MKRNIFNMDLKNITSVLMQRGYDKRSAKLVAPDLSVLSRPLDSCFEKWMKDPQRVSDFKAYGFSVLTLMSERGMSYPAAILTIDWLIKEPDKAIKSLKRGVK